MSEPSAPPKSFELTRHKDATKENRRPFLTGDLKGDDDKPSMSLALWPTTATMLTGEWKPASISDAAIAARAEIVTPTPKVDKLEVGRAILWKNQTHTAENNQPEFTGYARQGENHYLRLSVWYNTGTPRAKVEPYRPRAGERELGPPPPPAGAA